VLFRNNHKLFVKVVTMAGLCFVAFLRVLLLLFLIFVSENHGIVYTREQLIALCRPVLLPGDRAVVPKELRRRRRGCRSGVKWREKRRRHKPAVPAIIMVNVRSLMACIQIELDADYLVHTYVMLLGRQTQT